MVDFYIELARNTLELFLSSGKLLDPPSPLPPGFERQAGAFVSLHLKDESLRGCIGTFLPVTDNVAKEIIRNTIQSATSDPRFPPVRVNELPFIVYSVDILSPPEPIAGPGELNPRLFGVLVQKGSRRGLLLPDLPGVDTVETQLAVACQKADLSPREPELELFRFTVERHSSKASTH